MIRHCDGTDEFLVDEAGRPCACGLEFDDVQRSVVWPHERILTHDEKLAALDELAAQHADCGPDCVLGKWAADLAAYGRQQT